MRSRRDWDFWIGCWKEKREKYKQERENGMVFTLLF